MISYGTVKFLSNSCYDINHFILCWLWKRNSHNLTTKLDGLWVNISTWFLHSIFHKDKIIQHNMQKLQNQKLFWKEKSNNLPFHVSSYINILLCEKKQNLVCCNFTKKWKVNIIKACNKFNGLVVIKWNYTGIENWNWNTYK